MNGPLLKQQRHKEIRRQSARTYTFFTSCFSMLFHFYWIKDNWSFGFHFSSNTSRSHSDNSNLHDRFPKLMLMWTKIIQKFCIIISKLKSKIVLFLYAVVELLEYYMHNDPDIFPSLYDILAFLVTNFSWGRGRLYPMGMIFSLVLSVSSTNFYLLWIP